MNRHHITVKSTVCSTHEDNDDCISKSIRLHKVKIPVKGIEELMENILREHQYEWIISDPSYDLTLEFLDEDKDWVPLRDAYILHEVIAWTTESLTNKLKLSVIVKQANNAENVKQLSLEKTSDSENKIRQQRAESIVQVQNQSLHCSKNDNEQPLDAYNQSPKPVSTKVDKSILFDEMRKVLYCSSKSHDVISRQTSPHIRSTEIEPFDDDNGEEELMEHSIAELRLSSVHTKHEASQLCIEVQAHDAKEGSLESQLSAGQSTLTNDFDRTDSARFLEKSAYREVELTCSQEFTSVSIPEDDEMSMLLFWVERPTGLFGVVNLKSMRTIILLRDLKNPVKVMAIEKNVYILEEGDRNHRDGNGGRVSFWNISTGVLHILLLNLSLPSGLHVTSRHDIYFTSCCYADAITPQRTDAHKKERTNSIMCLPGGIVLGSIAGPNHFLERHLVKLISFPRSSGTGSPIDITMSSTGIIFVAYRRNGKTQGGSIDAFIPLKSNECRYRKQTLFSGISPVRELVMSSKDQLLYAGCGKSRENTAVAIGIASFVLDESTSSETRELQAQIHILRRGFAFCLSVDEENNVFFCCGLRKTIKKQHTYTLRVLYIPDYSSKLKLLPIHTGDKTSKDINMENSAVLSAMENAELTAARISHEEKRRALENAGEDLFKVASVQLADDSSSSMAPGKGEDASIVGKGNTRRKRSSVSKSKPIDTEKKQNKFCAAVEVTGIGLDTGVDVEKEVNTDDTDNDSITKNVKVNIQVILRCRPLFDWEVASGAQDVLSCIGNRVEVHPVNKFQKFRTFDFDSVYDRDTSQKRLYQEQISQIVLKAMQGYNCTVFAYGQTGSGKTHTMEGTLGDPEGAGIIPRCIHTIFERLKNSHVVSYKVRVSHLEIYNEELTDLLLFSQNKNNHDLNGMRNFTSSRSLVEAAKKRGVVIKYRPSSVSDGIESTTEDLESKRRKELMEKVSEMRSERLTINKDEDRGVFVRGLKEVQVRNAEEIFSILESSLRCRQTAETLCNKESSRSHTIFTVHIESKESTSNGSSVMKIGRLNLVDLSGSENYLRAGANMERQREAARIGQGLLALGRVIKSLVHKWPHVPYRESKLTRLLEDSLGGDAITTIILTVSPGHIVLDETMSTLGYASLAKKVRNVPKQHTILTSNKRLSKKGELIDDEDCLSAVRPWEGSVPIRRAKRDESADMEITHGIADKQHRMSQFSKTYNSLTMEWIPSVLQSNGKSTPRALAALRNIFNHYDSNKNDKLTFRELRILSRDLSHVNIYTPPKYSSQKEEMDFNVFVMIFESQLTKDPSAVREFFALHGYSMGLEKRRRRSLMRNPTPKPQPDRPKTPLTSRTPREATSGKATARARTARPMSAPAHRRKI